LAASDRVTGIAGAGIGVAAVEGSAEEADAPATLLIAVADVAVQARGSVGDRGLVAAEVGIAGVRGAGVAVVAERILGLAEDRAPVAAEHVAVPVAVVPRLREAALPTPASGTRDQAPGLPGRGAGRHRLRHRTWGDAAAGHPRRLPGREGQDVRAVRSR